MLKTRAATSRDGARSLVHVTAHVHPRTPVHYVQLKSCAGFSIFEAAGGSEGVGPRGSTRAPLCVGRGASGERLRQQRTHDAERGGRGAPRSTRDAGRCVPPARARPSGVDKHCSSAAGARGVDGWGHKGGGTAAQGRDDRAPPKRGGRAARSHLRDLQERYYRARTYFHERLPVETEFVTVQRCAIRAARG